MTVLGFIVSILAYIVGIVVGDYIRYKSNGSKG